MTTFFWHIHHDILCEPAFEPIENRIDYIKGTKPAHEIKTRLRLLRPVKGKLPKAYAKTGKAYVKARKAYDKARGAYDKARGAYDKAREAFSKALEACNNALEACNNALEAANSEIESLHKIECPDCPWDGTSIFPNKDDK